MEAEVMTQKQLAYLHNHLALFKKGRMQQKDWRLANRHEKQNKGPRRHYCISSGCGNDCLLTPAAVKLASIKPKEEKTLLKYVLENGIIKLLYDL